MFQNKLLWTFSLTVLMLSGCQTTSSVQKSSPPAAIPPSTPATPSANRSSPSQSQQASSSSSQSQDPAGSESSSQGEPGNPSAESAGQEAPQNASQGAEAGSPAQADSEAWPSGSEGEPADPWAESSAAEQAASDQAAAEDPWAESAEAGQEGGEQAPVEDPWAEESVTAETGREGTPGGHSPAPQGPQAQATDPPGGTSQEQGLPGGGTTAGGGQDIQIAMGIPGGFPGELPTGQTSEERAAQLEQVLNGSMVVFDGALLEEQKRAQAARQGSDSGSGGGSAGIPDMGEPGTGGEAQATAIEGESEGTASPSSPDTSGSAIQGAPGNKAGVVPEGIPSGDDDDVVARQLREAAMAETDPGLREKLWEEYKRYKNGTGN